MSDTAGAVQALLDVSAVGKALWIGSQKINLVPFRSGGSYTHKKKIATLVFHHVEYYVERQRRSVLSTVPASGSKHRAATQL